MVIIKGNQCPIKSLTWTQEQIYGLPCNDYSLYLWWELLIMNWCLCVSLSGPEKCRIWDIFYGKDRGLSAARVCTTVAVNHLMGEDGNVGHPCVSSCVLRGLWNDLAHKDDGHKLVWSLIFLTGSWPAAAALGPFRSRSNQTFRMSPELTSPFFTARVNDQRNSNEMWTMMPVNGLTSNEHAVFSLKSPWSYKAGIQRNTDSQKTDHVMLWSGLMLKTG